MTTIGPYEFVGTDVDTTLQVGWGLFDQLELSLAAEHVALVEPHRVAAEAMLDAVMACEADQGDALQVLWDEWRGAMRVLRDAGAYGPRSIGSVTAL